MSKKPISLDELKKRQNRKVRKEIALSREWYSIRSLLGYSWYDYTFLYLIGGRQAGKTYALSEYQCRRWTRNHKNIVYWFRLSESSAQKLLSNNAEKMIDPDLRRKYNLEFTTSAGNVYVITKKDKKGKILEKELFARVYSIATFYNDKGSNIYDKDFLDMNPDCSYLCVFDEMNREKSEKKSFDIVYNFANQIENCFRNTKDHLRIVCIGNLLDDCSDLLASLNFIPEQYGRYKIKKKRTIIEYIEPTEKYRLNRKNSPAEILMPEASTFTNKRDIDSSLVTKRRLFKPKCVIKFTKDRATWFTLWDNDIIAQYNNEHVSVIPMRPYLDEIFIIKQRDNVISQFDTRSFLFHDTISFIKFKNQVELLKPRK